MKTMKLRRALSLLLSLVMVFSMVYIATPSAYADDPDWPILTGFNSETSTVTWTEGVVDGFSSTIVDSKLVNNDTLTPRSDGGYYIGEITLYVDKLPSGDEVTGNPTATVKLASTTQDYREGKTPRSKLFSNITIIKNGDEFATSESVLVGNQACIRCNYHGTANTYFHYKVKLEEKSGTQTGLTLEEVSVSRDSMNNATVIILSSGSGSYYYGLFAEKQDSPSIDTTGDGETLSEGVNNISISSITDNYPRYLYIVGKDDSVITDPLEIRIPGVAFKLQHEIKALEGICSTLNGVPDGNYFYAEKFVDSKGNTITEAEAGEQVTAVFSINGGSFDPEANKTVDDRIVGEMVEYKLDSWDISGINVDPSPTGTSFEFTMPANDVSVNSVVSIIGQQVKFSSNIKAGEDNSKFISFQFYSENYGWKTWLETFMEGENEHIYTYKTGLAIRMRDHIKPGYEYGNYVLTNIDVYNNEVKLDITDETLYDTGFTLQEGDNYKLDFVFRSKAFAFITTASNDSSMGTTSASVNSTSLVYEGETVTLTATPNEGYVLKEWQVKDDNGTTIPVTIDSEDSNKASFVMTADYSDEITATAVFEAEGQEEPTVKVAQTSLTLNGDIGVNFYLNVPEDLADEAFVCINFRGTTTKYKVADFAPSSGMYKFTAKTYATEMRAPIVLTVEDASGNKIKLMNSKGTIDYTAEGYNYSIERYFTLAREQYTDYPKVLALVNAMDEYGKYAQNFFNNSGLEVGDVSDVTLAMLEQYKMVRTDMPAGLTYGGTTLVLDSTTAYRHYFAPASGHSFDDFTFTIDGKVQTLKEKDGKYYIEVSDIRADKLNEFKTLVISDGTNEYTIKYCALSYARTAVNQNLPMADVTRALYKYFVAADAYF